MLIEVLAKLVSTIFVLFFVISMQNPTVCLLVNASGLQPTLIQFAKIKLGFVVARSVLSAA